MRAEAIRAARVYHRRPEQPGPIPDTRPVQTGKADPMPEKAADPKPNRIPNPDADPAPKRHTDQTPDPAPIRKPHPRPKHIRDRLAGQDHSLRTRNHGPMIPVDLTPGPIIPVDLTPGLMTPGLMTSGPTTPVHRHRFPIRTQGPSVGPKMRKSSSD